MCVICTWMFIIISIARSDGFRCTYLQHSGLGAAVDMTNETMRGRQTEQGPDGWRNCCRVHWEQGARFFCQARSSCSAALLFRPPHSGSRPPSPLIDRLIDHCHRVTAIAFYIPRVPVLKALVDFCFEFRGVLHQPASSPLRASRSIFQL